MKTLFNNISFQTSITLIGFLFNFILTIDSFSQKQNPPGTTLLRDNLFIDEMPTCNVDYREYVYFLRYTLHFNLDTFERFVTALPYYNYSRSFKQLNFAAKYDSSGFVIIDSAKTFWNDWTEFKTYLNHPKFNFYPVVNISPEVAANYCKWRTLVIKMFYSMKKRDKERKKFYDDILYRLPTLEELEFAKSKFISLKNFIF